MKIVTARLESWMREFYFNTEIDIGSSGVQNFSMKELRKLAGITQRELDRVVFHDSSTVGSSQLRKAIADRLADGDLERVMVTHGSSEAIYLVMNSLLREGDEVVCLDPCYQQLFAFAESIGCRLKSWPLRFEEGFAPDIEEVKKIIGPQTKMVVVNFPHNPTGACLNFNEQAGLIQRIREVNAYLVWDAAFAELRYDAAPLPNPSLLYDRAITIGTLSKTYGLPGLRVGWLIAPAELLASCVHLRDYTTLHLSPLVEFIAQKAIEHGDVLLNIRLEQARRNLQLVSRWIAQHCDVLAWAPPSGGVCAFPKVNLALDMEAFCRRLAREYSVLLVPGTCFNRSMHFRLGFGDRTARLEEGLSRLSSLLSSYVRDG
jgi:capreomycidine synthase